MPRLKTSINFNKEIFGNSFRSVLWLRTELVRCFGLGPNYIGATPAAPNIWQFVFSVLYLRTECFRCFVLGPNWFGAT
jgi:hypothetical protein